MSCPPPRPDRARVLVALMRHGAYHQPDRVPSALLPHPLTGEGEAQAREGAATLMAWAETRGWDLHPVVHTSTLLRAWQTGSLVAQVWGERLGLDTSVVSTDALAERSVGAAANLTTDAIEAALAADPRFEVPAPGWKSSSRFRLPYIGAESLLEAGARVAAHVRDVAEQVATERFEAHGEDARPALVVCVGHGGAIRHAAVHLGLMTEPEAPTVSMWHASAVVAEPEQLGAVDGPWTHTVGRWKPRSTGARMPA